MADVRTCRACGSTDLQPAGPPTRRAVCGHCGRCWEDEGDGLEVNVLACPGCARRGTCEACPTWLSESVTQRHTLDDGGEVLIRPLVYGDRFELAAGFTELSLRSRQLRFFQPPETLGPDELEYLTNVDYQNHFALAALLLGGPAPKGIAVGRYLRDQTDPTTAEVAVTVMDEHQRRGVGTLLTRALARWPRSEGSTRSSVTCSGTTPWRSTPWPVRARGSPRPSRASPASRSTFRSPWLTPPTPRCAASSAPSEPSTRPCSTEAKMRSLDDQVTGRTRQRPPGGMPSRRGRLAASREAPRR